MEALSSSMQSEVGDTLLDTDAKPASPEKVCMMRGEASAEIGDEMTNNSSMQWPMNLEAKEEHDKDEDGVPKGPGLYQWFENQALSEAASSVNVDQVDPHSASIHEILEASRLSKNKDLLQLLDEMGSDNTSALAGNYWHEPGSHVFSSHSTDSYTPSGSDECHQYNDQHFRTFLEPLPLVIPSLPGAVTSCTFVQPGDGTIWTGQSATETSRGVTVECIQAGEAAFSMGQSSTTSAQELDDIRKQEEKKRKRRERNKQCSREFRRKQKVREQLLTRGKAEKEQLLLDRYKRMEKTTKILVKIATSSGACEKGQSIINRVAGLINKENLPCVVVKGGMVPNRRVSCTKTQAFG